MKFAELQKLAMSLGDVTEEPHFHLTSFRVNNKIFATVPPERTHVHIFVDEHTTRATADQNPDSCEGLMWGRKLAGLRVDLAAAKKALVLDLLRESFERKAPKKAAAKPRPAVKARAGSPARRSRPKGGP